MSFQALSGPQTAQVQVPGSGVMAGTAAQQKLARLTDAAQRFEGMMMQEMLKPMENSQSGGMWGGDDDPERDHSLDTMSSYGTEAVANALAKHGGMGIAKQVVEQVTRLDERTHGHAGSGSANLATAGLHSLGSAGDHSLASARVNLGGVGSGGQVEARRDVIPKKEQKGTAQVLKFGLAPPMR